MEALEREFLEETTPEVEDGERFVIDSIDKAVWAVGKIKERRAELAEVDAFVERQIMQIKAWREKKAESIGNDVMFFESLLKPYAAAQVEGKKSKSVKLPNGTLSFKKSAPNYTKDEGALLEFVKAEAPDCIKTKESVDWAEYKKRLHFADAGKLVTDDGEVVPGVSYEQKEDSFIVKLVE